MEQNGTLKTVMERRPTTKKLTQEELTRFKTAISSHRFWKPFCMIIMYTDIRLGDALALKWHDIDFENNVMAKRNMSATHFKPVEGFITIPLPPYLCDVLKEYMEYQERENALHKKICIDGSDLVFGNDRGEMRSYSGTSHLFKRFLYGKGLESLNITFPALKRTARNFMDFSKQKKTVVRDYVEGRPAYLKPKMTKKKDLEM